MHTEKNSKMLKMGFKNPHESSPTIGYHKKTVQLTPHTPIRSAGAHFIPNGKKLFYKKAPGDLKNGRRAAGLGPFWS